MLGSYYYSAKTEIKKNKLKIKRSIVEVPYGCRSGQYYKTSAADGVKPPVRKEQGPPNSSPFWHMRALPALAPRALALALALALLPHADALRDCANRKSVKHCHSLGWIDLRCPPSPPPAPLDATCCPSRWLACSVCQKQSTLTMPLRRATSTICSESNLLGVWRGANVGCRKEPTTWLTANQICVSNGLRLCTVDEVKATETEGTGCGFDAKRMWTSSRSDCASGKFKTMPGHPGYLPRCPRATHSLTRAQRARARAGSACAKSGGRLLCTEALALD